MLATASLLVLIVIAADVVRWAVWGRHERGFVPDGARRTVDVNRAGEQELSALAGIGPARAKAVVTEREENGPFADLEDLARVRGITVRTVEGLRAFATCGQEGHGAEAH